MKKSRNQQKRLLRSQSGEGGGGQERGRALVLAMAGSILCTHTNTHILRHTGLSSATGSQDMSGEAVVSVCSAPLSTSIYPATADLRNIYTERVVGGDGGVRGSHGGKQRQRKNQWRKGRKREGS
ncbi:unnamed protein product [Leuciscus chuanchicus]